MCFLQVTLHVTTLYAIISLGPKGIFSKYKSLMPNRKHKSIWDHITHRSVSFKVSVLTNKEVAELRNEYQLLNIPSRIVS